MATPPESTKVSLGQRLRAHARQRWPQLATINVRFRAQFAYVEAHPFAWAMLFTDVTGDPEIRAFHATMRDTARRISTPSHASART